MPLPLIGIRGIDEDTTKETTLIQGGLGACLSNDLLAASVAEFGGMGIISTVAQDLRMSKQCNREISPFDAIKMLAESARSMSRGKGMLGVNVMVAQSTYRDCVEGAIAGKIDAIIAGAGLPRDLPEIARGFNGLLIPIVSSAKALRVILRDWDRYGRKPDAIILEGPRAGGHLGFKPDEIDDDAFRLEALFPEVMEMANSIPELTNGIPVIVAGGIWDRTDIIGWIKAGAAGVQLGTRFLATHECGASADYKDAVLTCTADDIIVATNPGSPSGYPFRLIASRSEGYQEALSRTQEFGCSLGYMCHNGICRALGNYGYFCICNGLYGAFDPASGKKPIYTVGANGPRVKERGILSVRELMSELTGFDL